MLLDFISFLCDLFSSILFPLLFGLMCIPATNPGSNCWKESQVWQCKPTHQSVCEFSFSAAACPPIPHWVAFFHQILRRHAFVLGFTAALLGPLLLILQEILFLSPLLALLFLRLHISIFLGLLFSLSAEYEWFLSSSTVVPKKGRMKGTYF